MGARLDSESHDETGPATESGPFPPSLIHHPVSIWSPSGPIFEAEVKTKRMDFWPADARGAVFEVAAEVAIWIVHFCTNLRSQIRAVG
jgi:hypothetical protein